MYTDCSNCIHSSVGKSCIVFLIRADKCIHNMINCLQTRMAIMFNRLISK